MESAWAEGRTPVAVRRCKRSTFLIHEWSSPERSKACAALRGGQLLATEHGAIPVGERFSEGMREERLKVHKKGFLGDLLCLFQLLGSLWVSNFVLSL